jgi:hypothetical protein
MRISTLGTSPGFVADHLSTARAGTGRQVDFSRLDDSWRQGKKTVKLNGAVAAGATSLVVDALPADLPVGVMLNFGSLAPVTVTVNDGSVAAGDTAITIVALPGPIPSGTRLNFSGGTNAQVVEVNGDHAAGVTTLTVLPLDGTVANGATATFAGGTKQARVTAPAAAGATAVTVDELQFAIADNAEATYSDGSGAKVVPAGTIVAQLASGKVIPRKSVTGAETAIGFLVSDAADGDRAAARTGYGVYVGGVFYEELLPDHDDASFDTWIGEIKTAGPGVRLETYSDSSAS